tara:strand:- start:90 stop:680 length:591 start_codon:yes stop_codon:yes gene_type:complete
MASTLKINNLDTASGSTITIPSGKTLVGTSDASIQSPGNVIGYTQSAYTATTNYGSSSQQTMDAPLDGTYSYTTKRANSLLRVHCHFAPIRHYPTWEVHALRMFHSTTGSGGTYTQFYLGSQAHYTESYNVSATNVDLVGHITAGAAGTTYNFKVTVQGHANGNSFNPNQYNLGGGTSGTVVTDANSFISCMEIAQ